MTTTATADQPATAVVGRVARVNGPVVDIEFPHDSIPDIYNALKTTITIGDESVEITLEVAQHLGDDLVRAIALKPTDGIVRGQEVRDSGEAISVPVGDVTKGKVFNVIGEVLNLEPGETIEVTERWPIHRKAPRPASSRSTSSRRTCWVERSVCSVAPVSERPSSSRR